MAENHSNVANPNEWKGSNLLGFALMEIRDEITYKNRKRNANI